MTPLVYIIILTYNGNKWIDGCLNSVLSTNYPNFRVLVIDNASKDGSADYVASKYSHLTLIRNKKNLGFAEGNNIGMRYAFKNGAEYVVLLNQDTKVDPNWLTELVRIAESDPKIGTLSPMQYDYEGKDLDRNFKGLIQNLPTDKEFIETDRVIGAAMLYTRQAYEKVGVFDPIYFCYSEESDLCRRIRYFSYKIGIAKESKIYHWHSLIQENGLNRKTKYLLRRNEFIYALKNPNKPLIKAMLGYFKWKIEISVKKDGILNGVGAFFALVLKQVVVFFYIPRIIIRKNKEMHRGICK